MFFKKATEMIKPNNGAVEAVETPENGGDSRESRRKERKQAKRRYRVRLIPIWLRLIIVIFLLAASLAGGAMVGYGIVGKGDPMAVFHKETWMHIYNIVHKGTED